MAEAYGVLGGSGYCDRVTFLIDEQGNLQKVYPKVSPKEHPGEVLGDL